MNYLFIMPRFIQNETDDYMFPLGMAYVSASLKQIRNTVYCLNLNTELGEIEDEIRKAMEENSIDVVATGGLSPNFNQIRQIIRAARVVNPKVITMLGGGILTATPEVLLRGIEELDIGMIAEGEKTIQELAEVLEGDGNLEKVKGIVYRKNGDIVRTEARPDIENLDELPFPDYDGFHYEGRNEISICTSRSCPFNCSFCFHTCGKRYRARSMDNIFKEIDWLVEKFQVHSIGILDELFSTNNEKMTEFCNRIEKYNLRWSCQMRVDKLNVDVLKTMKKAGCISLSFGIENADNRILQSMDKHITIEQVEKALEMSREAGICPFGNLLLGDKADTRESFDKCLKWYDAHPDIQLGFNKILVLPGSKLYKYAVENGYIKDEVKYLEDENFAINITQMSDDEYRECVRIMDRAVILREYPLVATKMMGKKNDQKKLLFSGKCSLCGENINGLSDDFLGTKNGSCPKCGKPYTVNLYKLNKDVMEKKLTDRWQGKTVVLWGMGMEGQKMVHQSQSTHVDSVYLVDRNTNKQGDLEGKTVYSTDKLEEIKPDIVLIGTNAPVTNASIKKLISEKYPDIKEVHNLNEYLYEVLEG